GQEIRVDKKEVICNQVLPKCWRAKSVIIRVIRVIRVLWAHTLNQPLNPNPISTTTTLGQV
ncbi:MAG: hypothetical protein AB4426_01825, partial [Xenococcaceae cyanobacterium]